MYTESARRHSVRALVNEEQSMKKDKLYELTAVFIIITLLCSLSLLAGCKPKFAKPPLIFANDELYQYHDHLIGHIPELDDNWTYIGEIMSTVQGDMIPSENLQANTEIIGAEIYHSLNSLIKVNSKEFYGDCIIVVFEGQCSQYVSSMEHDSIEELLNATADDGMLLLIDGVMYRMRSTYSGGDDFQPGEKHKYLGDIQDAVPAKERPVDSFQINNYFVGAKVYQILSGSKATDELIVIYGDTCFEYKAILIMENENDT
jgi:hypothetical protein